MFTISQDSSCVAIGLMEKLPANKISEAIKDILHFFNENDVIISEDNLGHPEIYNNAKLYLDIEYKPSGVPVYCMICSVKIHAIIADWKYFLLDLSRRLVTDIFVEANNTGYLIEEDGRISVVKHDYFFVGDIECLKIETG